MNLAIEIRDVEEFPAADALEQVPTFVAPAALHEINDLEARIAVANDDADAALWEQAALVLRLLQSGVSQRSVARRWINLRTSKCYTHRHVQIVAQVAGYFTSQPRPAFRRVYNTLANAGTDRGRISWADLPDGERREVRRIAVEMDSFRFVRHTFFDLGVGHGGDRGVVGGAAGAAVYWDIVGGNPDGGRPLHRYTRSQVSAKIEAFITRGVRSIISDLIVDVARRRLAGDRSLAQPELPSSAGDAAVRSIWLSAASVADCELLAPLLGSRDAEETAAAAIALVAQWAQRRGPHDGDKFAEDPAPDDEDQDADLPDCLRKLTTPDYSDRTDEFEEALS